MLHFNRLEQTLEVSCAEALMVVSLDDFEEQSGSVLNRLRENLKEVALVVVVNEDLQLLQGVNVLLNLDSGMLEPLSEALVIGVGDSEELNASFGQSSH